MRILVVGCGSIGRRHIKNLAALDKIKKIAVYTRIKNCDRLFGSYTSKIKSVRSVDGVKYDFAVIANETFKHIDTALTMAKKGIHIFVEKPISHNLCDIYKLKSIVAEKKIKLFVGYNLRFLDAIKNIKDWLSEKTIGNLYFAKIEAGQYLPLWRRNIDYRNCYSSFREKGGGVALDLSHEIDYMRYFFGDPVGKKIVKSKVSNLKIDSEDLFEGLYVFKNNFVCNIHLDYLQFPLSRYIHIVGNKGIIHCDFIKKQLILKKGNTSSAITISTKNYFDLDRTYIDEMKSFIQCIENNSEPDIGLDDGIEVLKLIGN